MNRYLQMAKIAAYLVLCAFLLTAMDCAQQLTPKVAAALDSVQSIAKSTSDVEEATYATEGQVANLADSLNAIAQGLSSHEEQELREAQSASAKLSMLLDQADVDAMAFGVTEQATTSAINGFTNDSHTTLIAAQDAINQAGLQVSNPAIAESLSSIRDSAANVKDSTAQVALTAQQLSATATDARQVADHYRTVALAPVSKAKTATLFIATLIGRVLGL